MYYRIETEFTGELRPKTENPLPLRSDWTAIITHVRIFGDVIVKLREKGKPFKHDADAAEFEYIVGEVALPALADGDNLTVAISPSATVGSKMIALGFRVRADRWLVAYFADPVQLTVQTWTRLLFHPPDSPLQFAEQVEAVEHGSQTELTIYRA